MPGRRGRGRRAPNALRRRACDRPQGGAVLRRPDSGVARGAQRMRKWLRGALPGAAGRPGCTRGAGGAALGRRGGGAVCIGGCHAGVPVAPPAPDEPLTVREAAHVRPRGL